MKLTLSHMTKEFDKKYAVEDFSAEFERGVYGLLGPNGAGKTTLMRMMVDLLTPSSGNIQLDGVDISELGASYRDKLGYMPQEIGVYRNFSARRFLKYLSALKGIPSGEADEIIVSLLELVGLKDVADKKLGGFSGGMLRRIGIAQALLNDPKILILDEPTAGLDPQERIRFRNIISEISGDRIVLLSTHIVTDVEFIAGEVILMREGRLLRMDTTENLLRSVEGMVWSVMVPRREADRVKKQYDVSNIAQRADGLALRIVSAEKPFENAQPEQPTLEDVFLHYFGREAV
jgi:ABC-type multidrug transport system ATPase subunit